MTLAFRVPNRCAHLTNYSLNKYNSKFVPASNGCSAGNGDGANDEDGDGGNASKWSLDAYKRRLVREVGEERARRAWAEVDALLVKSLIMVEPTISEAYEAHVPPVRDRAEPCSQCFGLYGFDVMFDADLKPWLLEVNLGPSLATDSSLDLRVKSAMLIDLFNVVGLPVPPSPHHAAAASAAASPAVACAAAKAAAVAAGDACRFDGLNQDEIWTTHLVNAEFARSRTAGNGWRRLFPSCRANEFRGLFEPQRTRHFLPFELANEGDIGPPRPMPPASWDAARKAATKAVAGAPSAKPHRAGRLTWSTPKPLGAHGTKTLTGPKAWSPAKAKPRFGTATFVPINGFGRQPQVVSDAHMELAGLGLNSYAYAERGENADA